MLGFGISGSHARGIPGVCEAGLRVRARVRARLEVFGLGLELVFIVWS